MATRPSEPSESIRALLSDVIDYAGIFPPARLPLEEAVKNYAAYLQGEAAWMLSRFVCPAARLGELDELEDILAEGSVPWRFSALGRSEADDGDYLSGLAADIQAAEDFGSRHGGRARVDAIETRLPESVMKDGAGEFVKQAAGLVTDLVALRPGGGVSAEAAEESGLAVYFEVPFVEPWRRNVGTVIAAVAAARSAAEAAGDGLVSVGVKIRTGGVEAVMIPPIEQVAFFVGECARRGVPFKATAGLHHPIRHHAAEVDAKMHGFINVFAAAVLAYGAGAETQAAGSAGRGATASPAERPKPAGGAATAAASAASADDTLLGTVLAEERAESFTFDDDGMTWRGRRASIDQIRAARGRFALSFGSCSVTEPVQDLQALGWL